MRKPGTSAQRVLRCPKCHKQNTCELTSELRLGQFLKRRRRQVRVQCSCGRKWWTRNRGALTAARGLWVAWELAHAA